MFGETFLPYLDVEYSYQLAKRMEKIRSNPELGYRSAGSAAEKQTGDLLAREMHAIGLQNVHKDKIHVDKWEFHHAHLFCTDAEGARRSIQLGAYQTQFVTNGEEPFLLVYVGKGTAEDYAGKDVRGKIVLVEINQRDEWWISYPAYQAHLQGARAVIAMQCGGYGEIDEDALNAQDIGGPEDAPAFSISHKDGIFLKSLMDANGEMSVTLDADSRVQRDQSSFNIIGELKGRHPDRMILLSAHYDSYFSGFQDDNTAVAMMLGIAKALVEGRYEPENTILFCALAAEEWGVADSCFDWSTGAWEEVTHCHPDWKGKVIADLNFELPAMAHGSSACIRTCYEYVRFLKDFLEELPALTLAYPQETVVTAPIETWSDDFSMSVSGIPSMVNDFTGGSFMETTYHSQFDDDSSYDAAVYHMHHELFLLLTLAFDRTCVAPLCFTPVLRRAKEVLEDLPEEVPSDLREKVDQLLDAIYERIKKAEENGAYIREMNKSYAALLQADRVYEADHMFAQLRELEKQGLILFKKEQDMLTRIDWYGEVYYPHELLLHKLHLLSGARKDLQQKNCSAALQKLYYVDNNAYAFMFSKEVYEHFTRASLKQPAGRLQWASGRLVGHENLYDVITGLLHKQKQESPDLSDEMEALSLAIMRQKTLLSQTFDQMIEILQNDFYFKRYNHL